MKLKTILIAVLIAAYSLAQAQVSRDGFDKAVDFLNCKTVEMTLSNDVLSQYQQQCSCEVSNYNNISQFLIGIGKLDATIALSKEVETLKNTFKANWTKDEVIVFLGETIFNDKTKYQKIFAFAEKRNGKPEFEEYKTIVRNGLSKILVDIPIQKEIDEQLTLESRLSNLELNQRNINKDKSWFDGITFQIDILSILISLGLSLIILFIVLRNFSNEESEKLERLRAYVKQKISEASFNKVSPSQQTKPSEIKDLYNRIEYLENHIKILTDKINGINNSIQAVYTQPKAQKLDIELPEIKGEIFYLSTPNSDGSFNDSSASTNYKEGASIYRFTKTSSNRAKFQIDEREASIKLALQFPDRNIKPVCDAENAFDPQSKTIITTGVGEAELVGDKWINYKKAKIRYEN
jgi:hypothetical protein